MLLTEPTYLLSISHQMILFALAKTERLRYHSSLNTQRITMIFIRLLTPTTLLPQAKLSYPELSPKFSENLFNSLPPASPQIISTRKNSKTFRPAAATSSSNHYISQQQQSTAATSSSNQQQQPAAATSSSNQQQQSAAATSSSDQQQRPAVATSSSNQLHRSAAATSSDQQ